MTYGIYTANTDMEEVLCPESNRLMVISCPEARPEKYNRKTFPIVTNPDDATDVFRVGGAYSLSLSITVTSGNRRPLRSPAEAW